jgi:hypothetical protein
VLPDGAPLESDGHVALLRRNAEHQPVYAALAGGTRLISGELTLSNPANEPFVSLQP